MNLHAVVTRSSGILFVLSFASPSARAVTGSGAQFVDQDQYPYVCKIKITPIDDDSTFAICSSTLISPNTVLTAGHCFGQSFSLDDNDVEITCGDDQGAGAKNIVVPTQKTQWQNNQVPVPNSDYAIVTLDSTIKKVTPFTVAKNPSVYFATSTNSAGALNPGAHCQILGFGQDDSGNIGQLRQAKLDPVQLFLSTIGVPNATIPFITNTIYSSNQGAVLPLSVSEGDSGGPLICQAPGLNPELVGINGRYLGDSKGKIYYNGFTPVWAVPLSNP